MEKITNSGVGIQSIQLKFLLIDQILKISLFFSAIWGEVAIKRQSPALGSRQMKPRQRYKAQEPIFLYIMEYYV